MPNGFSVNDRRSSARARAAGGSGLVLGQSVASAKQSVSAPEQALSLGRQGATPTDQGLARQMAVQRLRKNGSSVGGTDLSFATQRPQDPFFYWQQNNLPYDFSKPDDLIRLRALCRHIYRAHSVMASAIDIYSQWPVVDMEIDVKDKSIKKFYEDLLFDQLDYYEFLPDLLREYWVVGEAFPLGSFNENLGIWEDDELINPDDVFVEKSPFVKEPNLYMRLPQSLRTILQTGQPIEQYNALMKSYPELQAYAHEHARMPVSNVLLKQVRFKCVTGDTQILTPTGQVAAQDLVVGDEVIAWDVDTDTPVVSRVYAQGKRAAEPIWEVKTKFGRSVRATGDHPFWTDRGWVEAQDLQPGDSVRVGSDIEIDGHEPLDVETARFLGIMVGDGTCVRTVKIHNVDQEILDWTTDFVKPYGCHLTLESGSEISWIISQGPDATKASPNQVRKVLIEHGLYGQTCHTKRIPGSVWSGGRSAQVSFLAGYYDTDGHWDETGGLAIWTSANHLLMQDTQALLSALGVKSRLVYVHQTDSYRVTVSRREAAKLVDFGFAPLLSRKTPQLRTHANRVLDAASVDAIHQRLATGEPASSIALDYGVSGTTVGNIKSGRFYRDSDVHQWDVIKSVEAQAPEITMAIGIEGQHTHITGGLVSHNTDAFSVRGLPIMYRALRPLMQEEMLNAAQDAISDRLYTPLILAKIGASATDLGTEEPWVPTQDQISSFENSLDLALAADFRVLTTHFAVDMETVFGRETMPNFDADFERLTEKQLQAFGLSKTMISGAGAGETYAADALNRDIVSQLLTKAQRYVRKFARDRMAVVAEAQGHFDYEVRGGKRYPIMEEVLVVDDETGEQRIVEQPKLLIPDLRLKTMSMKDDAQEREFIEALRAGGVPISQQRRLVNIDLDLEEEVERVANEQVEQAVEAQRVRKRTYQKLVAERLPIPADLMADFAPKPLNGEEQQPGADPTREPTVGIDGQDTSALAPTPEVQMMPPGAPLGIPAGPGGVVAQPPAEQGDAQVIQMPRNWLTSPDNPTRPAESDEMRARMPKPGHLLDDNRQPLYRPETGEGGEPIPFMERAGGIVQGPRHVGLSRHAGLDKNTPIGDADPDDADEPEEERHVN